MDKKNVIHNIQKISNYIDTIKDSLSSNEYINVMKYLQTIYKFAKKGNSIVNSHKNQDFMEYFDFLNNSIDKFIHIVDESPSIKTSVYSIYRYLFTSIYLHDPNIKIKIYNSNDMELLSRCVKIDPSIIRIISIGRMTNMKFLEMILTNNINDIDVYNIFRLEIPDSILHNMKSVKELLKMPLCERGCELLLLSIPASIVIDCIPYARDKLSINTKIEIFAKRMDVYYRNIELFNKMLINIFGKDDMDPLRILKDILDKDKKNKRCINLNSIPDDYRYILEI